MSPSQRAAAALAGILVALPASAFVRSTSESTGAGLFWPAPLVPYQVNPPDGAARRAPSCRADASRDPVLDDVRVSFEAWRQPCTDLELVFGGTIDEIRVGMNATPENVVVFRQGWCRDTLPAGTPCLADDEVDCGGIFNCFEDETPGDRSIVALTSVLYDPDSGRIVDADIEVNGWDGDGGGLASNGFGPPNGWYFTCNASPTGNECTSYGQGGCDSMDLRNTLTHEVGHFIGLRHVCFAGSPADRDLPSCGSDPDFVQTTMYPATDAAEFGKRTLDADDVAGVCAIYPATDGGCGCGSSGAPGALAVALAVLAWPGRRGRHATSRPA